MDDMTSTANLVAIVPAPKNTHANTPWNTERVEQLKTMWSQGYSCGQIAKELSIGLLIVLSRSAIAGRISRDGLPKRRLGVVSHETEKNKLKKIRALITLEKTERKFSRAKTPSIEELLSPEEILLRDLPPDVSEFAIPLMDLTLETCRFPLPNAMYCGAKPKNDHTPYCSRHHALCYRPVVRSTVSIRPFPR